MLPHRVILVLTLVLAWCWGAWHEELETAGWMFDHQHHHEADQSGSNEQTPLSGDVHKPVWARNLPSDARIIPVLQLLFVTLAFVGIGSLAFNLRVVEVQLRAAPKRRARDFDPVWHFVRRCAPDVAAPPALS